MTQTEPETVPGLDSDQLVVGIARGPGIWVAPIGTEMPADIDEDFGEGWDSLGYASEDGPTVATSTDSEDIRGWQALGVLRSLITGRTVTIQFQLMQWNARNLGLYWDIDAPTIEADGSFAFPVRSDQAGQRHQIGIDVKDGDNEIRLVFPRTQLNAAGDMQFQRSAAALMDVTFAALEDAGRLVEVMGRVPSINAEPFSAAIPAASGGGSSASPLL
jgi:hypothetical protein